MLTSLPRLPVADDNNDDFPCSHVSLQEFLLAIDVTSSGTPEEKLKWAFRMYDVDGNGVIDIQEMTKIVQVSRNKLLNLLTTHTRT